MLLFLFFFVQEFLDFSKDPVSLKDVLGLSISKAPSMTKRKKPEQNSNSQQLIQGKAVQGLPKAVFLSSWKGPTVPGHTAPHASIHHFCTETLGHQLPPQLAMVSKLTHSNKHPRHLHSYLDLVNGSVEEDSKNLKLVEKDFVPSQEKDLIDERLDKIDEQWDLVKQEVIDVVGKVDKKDDVHAQLESLPIMKSLTYTPERKKSSKSRMASDHTSSMNQSSPHDSSSNLKDTDHLITTARARLRKELKESEKLVPPSKELGVVGATDKQVESLLKKLRPRSGKDDIRKKKEQKESLSKLKPISDQSDSRKYKKQEESDGKRKNKDDKEMLDGTRKEGSHTKQMKREDSARLLNEKLLQIISLSQKRIGNFTEKVTK